MNHCDICNRCYTSAKALATHKLTNKHITNENNKNDQVHQINFETFRTTELSNKLSEYGLVIRDDSKLCKGYIDGSLDCDLNDVANRMCQMKYLYEYCNMGSAFQKAKIEIKKYGNGYNCHQELFDSAEDIALGHKAYPTEWPWLKK